MESTETWARTVWDLKELDRDLKERMKTTHEFSETPSEREGTFVERMGTYEKHVLAMRILGFCGVERKGTYENAYRVWRKHRYLWVGTQGNVSKQHNTKHPCEGTQGNVSK